MYIFKEIIPSASYNRWHSTFITLFWHLSLSLPNVFLKRFFGGLVHVRGQHWGERGEEVEYNISDCSFKIAYLAYVIVSIYPWFKFSSFFEYGNDMSLNKQENKSWTKGKIKPKHNISSVFYFFWEDAEFFFLSFCFQKDAN